ncbi:MAG: TauD/TfdA family dioxygenase [Beijerinckiaceae bacterium]|jgi:taurine dioxygenase|nr:TauD/TfdA family dioxygenase [Beijerinckiaceae bacterium]
MAQLAGNSQAIRIEKLDADLGVRIHGLDLNSDDLETHADFLRQQFVANAVMVLHAPDLDPNNQVRFARLFGMADADIVPHPNHPGKRDGDGLPKRGIIFISNKKMGDENVGSLPDGELHFHSDGAHRKSPYRATTLYSLELPSRGGETKFADLRAAYDALSDEMKHRLEGLEVHNIYDTRATLRDQTDITDEKLSNAIHPVVRTHPDTGRKSLYLSRLMTRNVIGMDKAASDALLEELFAHIEKDAFIYAHPWTLGDLLIWDNRSVNHARNDFPANETRHMRRVTVSEP